MVRRAHIGEEHDIARLVVASRQAARRGVYDIAYLERLTVQDAEAEVSRRSATPDAPSWMWVVEGSRELLGFARVEAWRDGDSVSESTAFLSDLYVHPQHFRQGFGSALVEAVGRALYSEGFRTLRAWVVVDAIDAVRFYLATGWKRLGVKENLMLDRRRVIELLERRLVGES
jgi:GNAT superfamily N-acetyltransferase